MKITEKPSQYTDLEDKPVKEILEILNREDRLVPEAVGKVLLQIEPLARSLIEKMKIGGRLFYIGSGTSGRLGIVDASECPPTFGVPHGLVVGIIAGGDGAIRRAVEFAEDDPEQAWKDLLEHEPGPLDTVVGISASGSTPYVLGGLKKAKENLLATGSISCNPGSAISAHADFPIEVITGPEVVTGSTRMKAGTAQKLVLNMITTSVMIGLGRVKGNRMVDMQLSNTKLVDRGTRMVMDELDLTYEEANDLLMRSGSVRKALESGR